MPTPTVSALYDPSMTTRVRPNDHLAVLMPKHLWKPDNLASNCDNLFCRVGFGIFERRHHCRKCGGCFCGACSSRTTPLLDTSNLPFVYPPRNSSIAEYESPEAPILMSRVCEDCWDQLHGIRSSPHPTTKRRPNMKRALTSPIAVGKLPAREGSDSSLSSLSPISPASSRRTQSLCPSPSNSSLESSGSSSRSNPTTRRARVLRTANLPLPLDLERSYGELDAYPLKRSSVLCKATGGGRWEPKQETVLDGYRPPVPGGKAPFELEMERQEREERRRRENPIIHHGDIQYRFGRGHSSAPRASQVVLSSSPFVLSTF